MASEQAAYSSSENMRASCQANKEANIFSKYITQNRELY